MGDEIKRTADWAPGTLDKTRKNIGEISAQDAAAMAKKLGGQVMYERSSASPAPSSGRGGAIVRNPAQSGGGKAGGANSGGNVVMSATKRRKREELPQISKKAAAAMDRVMMSHEYKIKPNYGLFNFVRTLQKNGAERILPEFYKTTMKQMVEHMENFVIVIRTLIQVAPPTYKAKISTGTEVKFKFMRMVSGWTMQAIKTEYITLNDFPALLTADLIPFVRSVYKYVITLYYYGSDSIPKLIKEIYSDMTAYPEVRPDSLSIHAKQAISEWLFIDSEIIKKMYPLLMRMCSDTYEPYHTFFNAKAGEILKFLDLHKFDLLLPEKKKEQPEQEEEEKPEKVEPPKKGIMDSAVETGLKLLDQMFPQAGFDRLDEHPDLYPYFQPLFKFADGFNLLSPENPLQVTMVLQYIIENCLKGCRNIVFTETEEPKKGEESIQLVIDEWSAYREEDFEHLYCDPLRDLVNTIYAQSEFEQSHAGKRTINALLWQTTYHFLPSLKFEQLTLERPINESKYRPLFHRTDFARKFLTLVINECDANEKTRAQCTLIENPWTHYRFDVPNDISKRLDILLGAQNRSASTMATNANLLKYTLCFIAVLDWWLNNPESPAYSTNPMHIWRVSAEDGRPLFSVPERRDQNKLFVDSIKANYKSSAK